MRYVSWGSVRGFGPLRETEREAERDVQKDHTACSRLNDGAYSDRHVYAVDEDGYLFTEMPDGERKYLYPSHGRGNGAVRI